MAKKKRKSSASRKTARSRTRSVRSAKPRKTATRTRKAVRRKASRKTARKTPKVTISVVKTISEAVKRIRTAKKQGKPRVLVYKPRQIGKSNPDRDAKRKALPPGKRVSKSGKVYYEYRKNRSDLKGKKV